MDRWMDGWMDGWMGGWMMDDGFFRTAHKHTQLNLFGYSRPRHFLFANLDNFFCPQRSSACSTVSNTHELHVVYLDKEPVNVIWKQPIINEQSPVCMRDAQCGTSIFFLFALLVVILFD